MQSKLLTVALIEAAKPCSKEYEIRDLRVPKLVLVVGSRKKSFKFISRMPGEKSTRFLIGEYPRDASEDEASKALNNAREIAAMWTAQVTRGLNPIKEAENERMRAALSKRETFRSVFQDFLTTLPNRKRNRTAHQDIMMLEKEVLNAELNPFVDRPIADVTINDIQRLVIDMNQREARTAARKVFWQLNKFYRWLRGSMDRRELYGVTLNPRDYINPKEMFVSSGSRDRHLSATELRCLWRVIKRMEYPMGPYFVMLLLTVQRRNEVAKARWSEFDLLNRVWVIPANRYKTGKSQVVPLPELVIELLKEIQARQVITGDFVFSYNGGLTPINCFSKSVKRLKREFAADFVTEHPTFPSLDFTLHDCRRTGRTQLAALQVRQEIATLILGHEKQGMDKVYNQYAYQAEIRDALDRWSRHLVAIGEAPLLKWIDLLPNRPLLPR